MSVLGIDLSLRSTGLVFVEKNKCFCKLVVSSSKDLNDEELIIFNKKNIKEYIQEYKPKAIGLEGLSFGSISSSKDILAGNFWAIRVMIAEEFPDIKVTIVPVLTWRSKLFNKEERKKLKDDLAEVKRLKSSMAKMSKVEKQESALAHEQLILHADIKYLTWEKLPEDVKTKFGNKKGYFDLTDAYFIAKHIETING